MKTKLIVVGVSLAMLLLFTGCPKRAGVDDLRGFAARAARLGLWNEARLRWEQALELSPGDPGLLNNIAVASEALGDYERARELYQRAAEAAPGAEEIRENLLDFGKTHRDAFNDKETGADEPATGDGGDTDDDASE